MHEIRLRKWFRWVFVGTAVVSSAAQADTEVITEAEASSVFAQAHQICADDASRLWGHSLCAPILLTDGQTRETTANVADGAGALAKLGKFFRGILPDDVLIANSPTEWSGTRWTQLVLPLPAQQDELRVLIGHELFHRVQPQLGLSRPDGGNEHLNSRSGRYLLQLEWRALAKALQARSQTQRKVAMQDAMAFRHERYRLFPNALEDEGNLEVAEGIAEYTGVMVGLATPHDRRAYAVDDLSKFVHAPTFVRSFAYATGPALGLVLDMIRPNWKAEIRSGAFPADLIARSLGKGSAVPWASRVIRYDDGSLSRSEDIREQVRLAQLALYRRRLVKQPVLVMPLHSPRRQFNPQTLVPLGELGTVYPTIRLVDDWGVLEVEFGGALYNGHEQRAAVPLTKFDQSTGRASGWLIKLNPGWSLQAGDRPGDLKVSRTEINTRS